MGCSASVPAPAPAAEPEDDALAAMSPSFSGSSRKSINAGAIAPELKAMAEASKRRTT